MTDIKIGAPVQAKSPNGKSKYQRGTLTVVDLKIGTSAGTWVKVILDDGRTLTTRPACVRPA